MRVEGSLSWYFLFAAWAAFYVAMSYARQLRAADRHAAMLAREAQEAQLRALRYQINPHFLFNTLNSLSSLILSQKTDVAERMLMNLSTFFRATLSADPTADVPLEEEIKLQRLYLDIEQIRFPDRLTVEVDVPEALQSARVPVLILQPIVENAVKYGVAKSRKPVTVRITAYEEAGRLHIKVKDDGEVAAEDDGRGRHRRRPQERLRPADRPLRRPRRLPARARSGRRLYRPPLHAGGEAWLTPRRLRVMVVDDEPLAVERLQLLLARLRRRDRRRHRQ